MSAVKTIESAAKKGVAAGAMLTIMEVTAGLLSGSLGLVSSAINTLLDFVAAVITFFAVRESGKPPDEVHMYGHEKIESAAAVTEIVILLVACSWIVYSAVERLSSGWQGIGFFWLALGTNFASILIDAFAYRNFKASSRERKSEAVEAGALHFLTDLLIAAVVIVGLVFYWFGVWYADSIAALCIVVYIVLQGLRAARESLASLTDAAPRGMSSMVASRILAVEGVESCHDVRIRRAGAKFFVDAHVTLSAGMPLYEAHSVASKIEDQIKEILPSSDILIHTEPYIGADPIATIRYIASQMPEIKGIHGISVRTIGGKLSVSYHSELEPELSVADAHRCADLLEQRIKEELRNVSTVVSHLEPKSEVSESGYSRESAKSLEREILKISASFPQIRSLHDVEILARKGRYSVTLHCTVEDWLTIARAHDLATKIEDSIRLIDERIDRVRVHCEPESTS